MNLTHPLQAGLQLTATMGSGICISNLYFLFTDAPCLCMYSSIFSLWSSGIQVQALVQKEPKLAVESALLLDYSGWLGIDKGILHGVRPRSLRSPWEIGRKSYLLLKYDFVFFSLLGDQMARMDWSTAEYKYFHVSWPNIFTGHQHHPRYLKVCFK